VSGLQLRAAALDKSAMTLVGDAAVIALVPATDDRGWAGGVAWQLARAVAAAGRRTALVDCFVHEPVLHQIAGAKNDEGIVDAFEYGASLQRIVQQQPEANLFFIPAGTYTPDPLPLTSHPRWRRLSAGFRHEDALLLLFCPDDALPNLAAQPDGMIVLAPAGMDLAAAEWPALAEALGSGRPPLLGVVTDDPAVAPPPPVAAELAAPVEPPRAADRPSRPSRPRPSAPMNLLLAPPAARSGAAWWIGAAVLVAAAGAAWYFRAELRGLVGGGPAPAPAVAPAAARPAPAVELLPFVVHASQWGTLRDAFRVADTLELRGSSTILTPVRLQGRVWYRVYVGPAASAAAAESLLTGLRAGGVLAGDGGEVLHLPLSITLPGSYTPAQAETERARLREAGVPTFILGQADGNYRLFAGAFDTTSTAVLLQDMLTPAGGAGSLGPRVGFVP
jgi:hypothetical protein